jgi:hypothetical protein
MTVKTTKRDLRFSRRWRFKSRSSGLWRRVVIWYDTNVSEDHAAFTLRVKWMTLPLVALRQTFSIGPCGHGIESCAGSWPGSPCNGETSAVYSYFMRGRGIRQVQTYQVWWTVGKGSLWHWNMTLLRSCHPPSLEIARLLWNRKFESYCKLRNTPNFVKSFKCWLVLQWRTLHNFVRYLQWFHKANVQWGCHIDLAVFSCPHISSYSSLNGFLWNLIWRNVVHKKSGANFILIFVGRISYGLALLTN